MASGKVARSFGTHDGTFHADEVTACALLIFFDLIDENKVTRTRDPAKLEKCEYVCDVGGIYDPSKKLFDHHQMDYQGPMSSAGMVLLYLKEIGKLSEKEHDFFYNTLIMGVDAHDNGRELHNKGVTTYSHIISNFTPIVHDVDHATQNEAFFQALSFSKGHIERMWNRHHYIYSCRQTVSDAMAAGKDVLIFEKALPWLEIFFELEGARHPAKFVIMPADNHWKLRGIPPSFEEKMKVRQPLPKAWAGLLAEDLAKISGIKGAIFCHKGRFISVWQTREDALTALAYIQKGR